MSTLRWVFEWIGQKRRLIVAAVVTNVASIIFLVMEPFLFQKIIDDVLIGGNVEILLPLIAAVLVVAFLSLGLRYSTNMLCEKAGQHVVLGLRRKLFDKILSQTTDFYRKNTAGDLITLCTGDIDFVRHFIAWVIPLSVECIVMVLGVLIIFVSVSPLYALCLFLLTPVSAILAFRLSRAIRPMHARVRDQRARLSTVVNENISGNRVIKAFVREPYEIEKFEKENEGFKDAQNDANFVWLKYQPYMEYVAHALNIVNLIVGAILVMNGNITLGQMNIFLSLAWALNNPMLMIGNLINDAQRFHSSAEKLMLLEYSKVAIESKPDGKVAASKRGGDVVIDGATVVADQMVLLDNVSLTAKPGQTIGIMGPTGSGKTVLVSLIGRFVDARKGKVLVDGVDVKDWNLQDLRSRVGMTTQDVFMFSDTVESNVAYGEPDAPMEAVEKAAYNAQAAEFIERLPQKYETVIGERGVGLSGGQRQRLSLARALLPNPSILILDDTTSAVDMETEKIMQEKLAALDSGATKIIITQRPSSVRNADYIYVLEDGRVASSGTHDELMQQGGYYYECCKLQQLGVRI